MKARILYLLAAGAFLLGACVPIPSPVSTAAAAVQPRPQEPGAAVQLVPAPAAETTATAATTQKAKLPASAQNAGAQNAAGPNAAGAPPAQALAACQGKSEQASCEFTWEKGTETGLCETVKGQLACSPKRDGQPGQGAGQPGGQTGGQAPAKAPGSAPDTSAAGSPAYNIEQAISDKARGMTIAFDALAFLTGDLGSDSFFPPGKVADFWGFQYLRDNDSSEMGHAGDFLTSASMNVLNTLTADQRAKLVMLAKSQVSSINEYGYMRFVLMDAFRRLANGDLPAGTTGLSEDAVKAYSAKLYQLDGEISFARAELRMRRNVPISTPWWARA